jgi:hypothetical protein
VLLLAIIHRNMLEERDIYIVLDRAEALGLTTNLYFKTLVAEAAAAIRTISKCHH